MIKPVVVEETVKINKKYRHAWLHMFNSISLSNFTERFTSVSVHYFATANMIRKQSIHLWMNGQVAAAMATGHLTPVFTNGDSLCAFYVCVCQHGMGLRNESEEIFHEKVWRKILQMCYKNIERKKIKKYKMWHPEVLWAFWALQDKPGNLIL